MDETPRHSFIVRYAPQGHEPLIDDKALLLISLGVDSAQVWNGTPALVGRVSLIIDTQGYANAASYNARCCLT